jgi:lysophospholipase L1-like esterase
MLRMKRREFLAAAIGAVGTASVGGLALAQTRPAPAKTSGSRSKPAKKDPTLPDDLAWHDVREWGVVGRAFDDTESYFDRLPARAKGVVRPAVWNLSRDSAGMSVGFEANAPAIYIRYELNKPELSMPHMPATGVSGVDLYGLDGKQWKYIATHQPREQSIEAMLCDELAPGKRRYRVHLPLYNGVKSMAIGLPKGSADSFTPSAPSKQKPVLFYGTSITQGGCASRPGMAFTNIVARRLDRTVLNFGFSGNGRMETSVGQFLAEIDAAVFVLDCTANMKNGQDITAHGPALIQLLREKRGSEMPILLVNERPRPANWVMPHGKALHQDKSQAMKQVYDRGVAQGDKQLYFHGDDLIGDDGEATVDNSHPTDLGMMRYTDALEPVLRKLLAPT